MRKEKNCNRCNKVKHYSFASIEALRKISNFFINLKKLECKKRLNFTRQKTKHISNSYIRFFQRSIIFSF